MSKQKYIVYAFWTIVFSILVVGTFLYLDLHKKNTLADAVVVRVNDKQMTASELSESLVALLQSYDLIMAKDPQVVDFSKNKIVDDFINQTLLLDWAVRNQITVSREEIDSEVKKIRSLYPDDLSFKEALAQSHQSLAEWEKKIEISLLQKKVFAFLNQKIQRPTDNDLRSYYNSNKEEYKMKPAVRIRQVVVDNEDIANRIWSTVRSNASLSDIAKKYSTAPEAKNGGDIGWVEQGTVDIFDRAFQMRAGQRSGVVKSPYGFHIFEVIEKRGEQNVSFEEARLQIERLLISQKEQAIYSAWLEEQIRNSNILKNEAAIKAIQVKSLEE